MYFGLNSSLEIAANLHQIGYSSMNKWTVVSTLCMALVLAACDDGKKAQEAAAAAEASASAAKADAEKAAAEATKKAADEAAKAFADKKAGIVKGLQGQVDAFDRKFTYLKEKAEKLKG